MMIMMIIIIMRMITMMSMMIMMIARMMRSTTMRDRCSDCFQLSNGVDEFQVPATECSFGFLVVGLDAHETEWPFGFTPYIFSGPGLL